MYPKRLLPGSSLFLIFSAVFLLLAVKASSQTTILYDGFEGNAPLTNRWTVFDVFDPESETPPVDGWGVVNSTFGGEGKRGGTNKLYSAAIGYAKYGGSAAAPRYPDEETWSAIERPFDLTGYSDATLTFWYKIKIPVDEWFDYFEVYVDDDLVFGSTDLEYPVSAWTMASVPLRDFAGGAHTLRFEFYTDGSNDPDEFAEPPSTASDFEGVYVDDVLITGFKTDHPDMDFDGRPDLLWKSSNGSTAGWLSSSNYLKGVAFKTIGPGWRAVGTSDFNRDGSADIVFQHDDGRIASWLMNGSLWQQGIVLTSTSPVWQMAAITDFNNDGNRDFIFQHNDGRLASWQMNGTNLVSKLLLNNNIAAPNRVVAAFDLNWDGQKDILFQRTDGALLYWLMNGTNVISSATLGRGASGVIYSKDFKVRGVTDFDGDGQPDLLIYQPSTGKVFIWYLESSIDAAPAGVRIRESFFLRQGGAGWTLFAPN